MKKLLLLLLISFTVISQTRAQTDPNNIPKPPITELKNFNPYMGTYQVTSDFLGRKFQGSLEWKPAIKNWFLQWTMLLQDESKKIDRELRIMMTWDAGLQKYRLWRFETTPPASPEESEGETKFVNNELLQEWKFKDEKGNYIFRNRMKMTSPDKLLIISEEERESKITQIGITTCTRTVTKNKYTL